ncbi:hypothetical protein CL632_00015 [bacterium]|nr:hypothetical protein [bacterium]MDP6756271.1 F0F1 ATP synthase subunit delta [Patescibacteria group bacterium]|tara:strand:- start:49 stop:429 length:381 start_codon:yes stop_codon:yes gene_type:complete
MNTTSKQYALAWYELTKDKDSHADINKKVLTHLHASGKLTKLPEIMRHLEKIEHQKRGLEHVIVTTAHEISDSEAKKLAKDILKQDITISKKLNPELIGGMQIETRNKRWDLSIRNSLNQLQKQLI